MKKLVLAIIVIASINSKGYGQQKKLTDLIGHWVIVNEKDSGASLEIIDSSTIILSYNGEKKKIIEYKIDFTRSPIWFDFSTTDTSSFVAVKSLLEIINDNTIKWQLFIDEERTEHFSSTKGELFYLRKTKPVVSTAIVSN